MSKSEKARSKKTSSETTPEETTLEAGALLGTIVKLLDDARAERRVAAAIVLGELAQDEEDVLEGLRKATKHEDAQLRRHAAEALGNIAPPSIAQDLRLLLKDPDAEVRDTTKKILASGRGVSADDIARMLEARDEKQKLGAIAVLGAMGGVKVRRTLLHQIPGGSPKILEAAVEALTPMLAPLEPEEAGSAVDDLNNLIEPTPLAQQAGFAQAVVELLSLLNHDGAAEALLRVAQSGAPQEAKVSALQGIRKLNGRRKLSAKVFKAVMESLEQQPAGPLLNATADALAEMDVPMMLEPKVRALLGSEVLAIRRFAMRALGNLDAAPAAKALAKAVEDTEGAERDLAIESALNTANGRIALAKGLATMTDEAKARAVAQGLRTKDLPPQAINTLEDALVEAHPQVAPIIIELLRALGRTVGKVQETLHDKGMKLKLKGHYLEAADFFRRITQANPLDYEARYQLGVCELKTSRRVIARGGKNTDPAVLTFANLGRARDFPLLDRLKEESAVQPEELYFLAFSLAEGTNQEQVVGGDILAAISESSPDPKLKQMAHNKLVTMGWAE